MTTTTYTATSAPRRLPKIADHGDCRYYHWECPGCLTEWTGTWHSPYTEFGELDDTEPYTLRQNEDDCGNFSFETAELMHAEFRTAYADHDCTPPQDEDDHTPPTAPTGAAANTDSLPPLNADNISTDTFPDIERGTVKVVIDYDDGRRAEWEHSLGEVRDWNLDGIDSIKDYARSKAAELAQIPTYANALCHILITHPRLVGMCLVAEGEYNSTAATSWIETTLDGSKNLAVRNSDTTTITELVPAAAAEATCKIDGNFYRAGTNGNE